MLKKSNVKDMYSLSPMQEGMLFHYLMDKKTTAYFEQMSYRVSGEIDKNLFEQAFNHLIERYDVLRTIFIYKASQKPRQVLLKQRKALVYYEDMSLLKENEADRCVRDFKQEDKHAGFNLSKDILIRLAVLKRGQQDYEIIWSFHHIIMDGWCTPILIKEMMLIYTGLKKGEMPRLPPAVTYRSYIKWLEKQDKKIGIRYWQNYLNGYETQVFIPQTRKKQEQKPQLLNYQFNIEKPLMEELTAVSRQNETTINTIFRTLWGILLQKYSNTHDAVFGAVVSGRPAALPHIDKIIGLFINTIPVRVKSEPHTPFEELFTQIQEDSVQSNRYEYMPLAEIQAVSPLKRDLVTHIIVFENYPADKEVEKLSGKENIGFSVTKAEFFDQTHFDITVGVVQTDCLTVNIIYNSNLYEPILIENIGKHLQRMMEQVAAAPGITVSRIEIISRQEKQQILYEFNGLKVDFPRDKTIHRLFAEQAGKTPDNIAVIGTSPAKYRAHMTDMTYISYKELNQWSDGLAASLGNQGIGTDQLVGIMMQRSPAMAAAVLAVWKAGGAYIPIDPDYPEERKQYMLKDSNAHILLTHKDIAPSPSTLTSTSTSTSTCQVSPTNLAYVIYTSGSTGKPKGVMVEHIGMMNHMQAKINDLQLTHESIVAQNASHTFDISLWQFFAALAIGGRTIVYPNQLVLNPHQFMARVTADGVTILEVVPSYLSVILYTLDLTAADFSALEYLVVTGEVVKPALVNLWFQRFPSIKMVNGYGPTEASDNITHYKMDKAPQTDRISIGSPLQNLNIYILDQQMNLCPIGVKGEICVSGIGVGRGYLKDEQKTKQVFMTDPFVKEKNVRFYKTGDSGCWLPDGTIDFFGRKDDQVKIRGYRIQLGEIENRLLSHPAVRQAVVLTRENKPGKASSHVNPGDKYLCAYVVTGETTTVDEAPPTAEKLKTYLARTLPGYMIPANIMQLEELPLTSNGKVDRKALPQPDAPGTARQQYEAPRTPKEEKMARIWSEVLDRDGSSLQPSISIDDNFFHLGGHSLKAMILISRIHKQFNKEIPLAEIFNRPTIRELSDYLVRAEDKVFASIEPVEKRSYYPVSSAQNRLFVLQQMTLDSVAYNIPATIVLDEAPNIEQLEKTFLALIRRHESLRTSFQIVDGQPVQRIHDEVDFKIETRSEAAPIDSFIRAFDLSQAPLLRAGIVKTAEGKYILTADVHHIISDGYSHLILEENFRQLYREESLSPLRLQYKDFSQWQDRRRETSVPKQQETWWLAQLAGELPVLQMPTDYPRPPIYNFEGNSIHFDINTIETRALKQLARSLGTTLYILILTLYNIMLSKVTGQEDIIIGTPIVGRRHVDLEPLIGMFVNTLTLRNYPEAEKTIAALVKEINNRSLAAFENQEYPFDHLVEKLELEKDTSRNPLFDVVLSYHDTEVEEEVSEGEPAGTAANPNPVPDSGQYQYENRTSKFDLTLYSVVMGDKIACTFQYRTTLFKKETIQRFTGYFKQIISQVLIAPQHEISGIEIIGEEEKKWILFDLNKTGTGYPHYKTIHRLFQEQAAGTPDNIAVVGTSPVKHRTHMTYMTNISYKELNKKSNQLARLLQEKGVKPGTIAAIMVDRSLEMIIGILGILKAGGVYLPIDPDYPGDRIRYILEDSQAAILLTDGNAVRNKSFTALQESRLIKSQPRVTDPRAQVTDFDSLPIPDRSLVNYERYNQYIGQAIVKHAISLQATRGCPYNCAYCHKIWPKKHVVRSAENIFEEVRLYFNMGVRRFIIIDDIFNLNIKNSTRFFQLITENRLDLQLFFPNGLRGDILTREYIDLMVNAGTMGFALALETASPRLQKMIAKNLNLEKLRENLDYICEKYPNVILELFIMHGFPTETEEEAKLTLDFVKGIKWLHFPYFHILKIYPNTDMEKLALENGVTPQDISRSQGLAYHQLPKTLPFDKNFTLKCQADFFNGYFLSKERLLHVLPYQKEILTEDEIVQKYNSYLPVQIDSFDDLLEFTGISKDELAGGDFIAENSVSTDHLNEKIKKHFPGKKFDDDSLRVLLLDLSQHFSSEADMLYDVVEAPLGLINLLTYLNRQFGKRINGKIAKSRIDFDNYRQLKEILDEFTPGIIGIRTLTYYRDFFHKTVAVIRNWGITTPIIAGGPYATSDYPVILQDRNVDILVLGEGEITFGELVEKVMENKGKLPGEKILKEIAGIVYVPVNKPTGEKPGREVIFLNELDETLSREPVENPAPMTPPTSPAYIIYTSGTTGRPKGVLIEHKNVVRLLFNDDFQFDFSAADVWTMFHSYSFDFSVWEMYGALLYGGKLIMVPTMTAKDPQQFLEVLKKQQVTILNQTPSAFYNLINQELPQKEKQLNLKYVIFGGEALSPGKLKRWQEKYPETKLVNMFGITETTVHVTYKEITPQEIDLNISNIGTPIPTTTTYALDAHLNLLPAGIPGELYVGGHGVARGYLNRPELTVEKFDHDMCLEGTRGLAPLSRKARKVPVKRINMSYMPHMSHISYTSYYKTGDLVKLSLDGDMEYLGRIDAQVQIRGHRIEPGEIQTQLLNHDDIKDAIVINREDQSGNNYLCAYLVSTKEINLSEMRAYLSGKLPDYMIPNYFVQLERIPLTANGKINRKQLPPPTAVSGDDYRAPGNEIQEALAAAWQEVLNLEKPGITDNYFQMGGDSIKAIQLISKINNQLKADLRIVDLYLHPTIEELTGIITPASLVGEDDELSEATAEIRQLQEIVLGSPDMADIHGEIDEIYPMSDIEQAMLYHYLKDTGMAVYHDQSSFQVQYHEFDIQRMNHALKLLMEKHPILRAGYRFEDSAKLIYKNFDPGAQLIDITHMEQQEQEKFIEKYAEESRAAPFDTLKPPLWRMCFFKIDHINILVVWEFHHAIIDGWSSASFLTELNNLYLQLKDHPDLVPPPLQTSYEAFILCQIKEKKKLQTNIETSRYWKNELQDYKRLTFLPTGQPDQLRKLMVHFDPDTGERLNTAARTYNTSLKHLCFAAYAFMLMMFSYEDDIVVGLVANTRPEIEDGDKLLGCFLNTVPVRIKLPPGESFTWADYIRWIEQKMLDLKAYDKYSLADIMKITGEKTQSQNPLFDTYFNFIDFYAYNQLTPDELQEEPDSDKNLELVEYEKTNTMFDFGIRLYQGQPVILLSYSNAMVTDETAKKCCNYFEALLDQFVFNGHRQVSKTDIMPEEEKRQLLKEFNSTGKDYPGERTIHRLFEEQVERTPGAIAVISSAQEQAPQGSGVSLTYRQLNRRANQLARILIAKGARPGRIVGLMVERSPEMLIGILAVLKAGGGYLPVDIMYPTERIAYMTADSRVGILLTQPAVLERFRTVPFDGELIDLFESPSHIPAQNLSKDNAGPADLAYLIYTSGSTGKPKGVMIEHRSVVNFITAMAAEIPFDPGKTILALTTISFDIFVLETLVPLTKGLTVAMANEAEQNDPQLLEELMAQNNVTMLQVTPSRLKLIASSSGGRESLKPLTDLIVGGEPFPENVFHSVKEALQREGSDCRIYNVYGPTETTVWSTLQNLTHANSVIIGRPIANTQIFLLDPRLQPVPIGVPGELSIGGHGLARGYINQPELTAEKFKRAVISHSSLVAGSSKSSTNDRSPKLFPNDQCLMTNDRLYRTGDLVRWLPDGTLEFLERIDHQVKIRGFRIELEEIEGQLAAHPDINEAAVTAKTDKNNDRYLAAYIVSENPPTVTELREYLAGKLPNYMIPSYFSPIQAIPLTANGKKDRKALPDIDGARPRLAVTYVEPQTHQEKEISHLWAEILKMETVGMEDNFFDLGGNSMDIMKLNSRLNRLLSRDIPVLTLFEYPTIRSFLGYLNRERGHKEQDMDQMRESAGDLHNDEQALQEAVELFEGAEEKSNE